MNLKEEIRKIAQLQEIDSRIYDLRQEKEVEWPAQLEKLKNEYEEKKKNFNLLEGKIKSLQVERKSRELDLASKEEAVKKASGQLYQLKTNKEYQIKLTEISSLKADVSVLEEEVLKTFEVIEGVVGQRLKEQTVLSQEEKKYKEEENKISNRIKEIEGDIKGSEDRRNMLVRNVDEQILSKYEKLLKIRFGLAIVPLKSESCGACHLRMTPQTINEIKMYKELVFCGNCVRILYILEDIERW
ncbi:MAG: hypothetical protein KJ629_07180 [Candidatus Omnitrophica bacterium]|nr:hypothetical protein [Candidatus Omnitrophota bacterium]